MIGLTWAVMLATMATGIPAHTEAVDPALPPVRVILNRGEFSPGQAVHVQVETGHDGYLIVMKVDGDGRIRVIFPVDPDQDAFVRGNRRYELRGRNETETFRADDLEGSGQIFAALSLDPLSFAGFSVGDHWDYETLRLEDAQADAEVDLHRFVREMSRGGRYDFDIKSYRVLGLSRVWQSGTVTGYLGARDPYRCLSCNSGWYGSSLQIGIRLGSDSWVRWYDPYWYDSYWYDPWRYQTITSIYWTDPWWRYDPWGYPVRYPGQYRPYTVIDYRPRNIVNPVNPHAGERARPRPLSPQLGAVSGVLPVTGLPGQTPGDPARSRARARPELPVVLPGTTRGNAPPPQVERRGVGSGDPPGTSSAGSTQTRTGTGSTTPPARARQTPPGRGGTGTTGSTQAGNAGVGNTQRGRGLQASSPPPRSLSSGRDSQVGGTAGVPPEQARTRRQEGRQAIVVIPGRTDAGGAEKRPVREPPAPVRRDPEIRSSDRSTEAVNRGKVTRPPAARVVEPPRPVSPPRTVAAPPPRTVAAPPTQSTSPVRSSAPPPASSTPPVSTSSSGSRARARGN